MATTAQEFWKGTNGDAWPVGNWHNPVLYPTASHASTIDIQSNTGHILPSTADAVPMGAIFLRRAPVRDCDVTVTVDYTLNVTGNFILNLRATLDMDANARPTNSVNVVCDVGADTVTVDKEIAGVNTSLSGAVAFTQTVGTPFSVRARVVGPSIKVKWWTASSNEPSAWNYETNDGSTVFSGYVGLSILTDVNGNSSKFTNFSYTDLTPAPPLLLARLKRRLRKPVKPPHVVVSWSGQGTLQTDGTFAGTSTVGHKSAGTLATDGTFTGAGKISHKAAGTLSTGGTFTGAGVISHKSAGTLQTDGTFTGAGKITHKSAGTLATDGTFTGAGKVTHKTAGTLATDGTFTGTGLISHKSAGTLATNGTFTGAGTVQSGSTTHQASGTLQTDGTFVGAGTGGTGGTTPEEPQHGGLGRRGPYTPVDKMRHKQLLVREDEELMVLM